MLIDAHLHLQDTRLDLIRPHLGIICQSENIGLMGVNGTTEADWPLVANCVSAFRGVVPSFGLHPWWMEQRSRNWLQNLETQLKAHRGGIGEIGLDRWFCKGNIEEQEEVFLAQWELANRLRLPVTIHCLKAWGRLLKLIQKCPHQGPGFLLHSYSGPLEMVDEWVKLGARFSISGYFAAPRKVDRIAVFQHIPLDRLLIETDAPDMVPPEELRKYDAGKDVKNIPINHPGNLRSVYGFTAQWIGITPEALELPIEKNFRRMFQA